MRTFPKLVVAVAATLALVAGLVAPAGAKVKIKIEYEKTQKFDGIKTWTWLEDPKVINKSTNPNVVNDGVINQDALSPPTKAAVEREMAAKGYRMVGAGEPADVQVAVWLIGSAGTSTQELGQFLPYYASFTLGMTSYGPAQSMRIYETARSSSISSTPPRRARSGARRPAARSTARTPRRNASPSSRKWCRTCSRSSHPR